jgi:hypothetical protein
MVVASLPSIRTSSRQSARRLTGKPGSIPPSTFDLDQYFGNIEGKFTWGEKGFSQSADSISVVDGLLIAQLKTSSGKYMDDQVDLDVFFQNNDGVLEVKPASTSISVDR